MGNRRWSRAAAVGLPPVATWPTVATELLEPAVREKFEAKHKAVSLYLSGVPTQEIFEQTGIQRWDLPRMVKRCMDLATDGRILGFRGLLPYLRVTGYTRKKVVEPKRPQQKGGHTGALGAVLARFPDIEAELIALLKKERKGKRIHEHKIRGTTLHRMFQDCLRERGVTETEWPFNTSYLGIRSIQRFMKELLDANFDRSVNTREEKPAKAHLAVGRGIEPLLLFEEPFDAVELDAYSINAFFSVLFETPEGTQTSVQLERLWLLALIDRAGSAALAYSIVYSSEVSADDVIKVIRDAVSKKWQPMELTIKGLRYHVFMPDQRGSTGHSSRGASWVAYPNKEHVLRNATARCVARPRKSETMLNEKSVDCLQGWEWTGTMSEWAKPGLLFRVKDDTIDYARSRHYRYLSL